MNNTLCGMIFLAMQSLVILTILLLILRIPIRPLIGGFLRGLWVLLLSLIKIIPLLASLFRGIFLILYWCIRLWRKPKARYGRDPFPVGSNNKQQWQKKGMGGW